jgi:chromosomal replication initiation ATPase DnaA
VLSGNEESLEEYYKGQRRSPILGGEAFIERVKQPATMLAREYPRYERRAVQADPEKVMRKIVEQYNVKREEIFRGVRGRENEARKVAMYLVKRCCDRTLPEIADYFGTNGYATISWNCRVLESKMAKDMKFKDRIEKIAASIQL